MALNKNSLNNNAKEQAQKVGERDPAKEKKYWVLDRTPTNPHTDQKQVHWLIDDNCLERKDRSVSTL